MFSWISRLPRLRAVYDRVRTDPGIRGRASEAIGLALLADGLVGLDNPLAGRDRRPGIFGAILITAIGIVFIVVGGLFASSSGPYSDGIDTTGRIVAVHQQPSDNGKLCSVTVRWTVDGKDYETDPGDSSNTLCDRQGEKVTVSYREADPSAGRPQLAESNWAIIAARVAGWIVTVVGVFTFFVRLAEIIAGIVLLVRGRRLVKQAPPADFSQTLESLRAAWSGATPPAQRS